MLYFSWCNPPSLPLWKRWLRGNFFFVGNLVHFKKKRVLIITQEITRSFNNCSFDIGSQSCPQLVPARRVSRHERVKRTYMSRKKKMSIMINYIRFLVKEEIGMNSKSTNLSTPLIQNLPMFESALQSRSSI